MTSIYLYFCVSTATAYYFVITEWYWPQHGMKGRNSWGSYHNDSATFEIYLTMDYWISDADSRLFSIFQSTCLTSLAIWHQRFHVGTQAVLYNTSILIGAGYILSTATPIAILVTPGILPSVQTAFKIALSMVSPPVVMHWPWSLPPNWWRHEMFDLLNKKFTFDVDVSNLPRGLNSAQYFSEMYNMSRLSANKPRIK